MFNKVTKSFQYGQHTVVLETGEIARQSSGAVLVTVEDTVVLATVVAKKEAAPAKKEVEKKESKIYFEDQYNRFKKKFDDSDL